MWEGGRIKVQLPHRLYGLSEIIGHPVHPRVGCDTLIQASTALEARTLPPTRAHQSGDLLSCRRPLPLVI
jgi:hypothetical protein